MKRILAVLLVLVLIPAFAAANGHILRGELGNAGMQKSSEAATAALQNVMTRHLGAVGNEEMSVQRTVADDRGTHYHFSQSFNGREIVGAEMMLHVDLKGNVYGLNGDFVLNAGLTLSPAIGANEAFASVKGSRSGAIDLAYVLTGKEARLAWNANVDYNDKAGPQRDRVFVDAVTGVVVARHAQFKYALSMETRDCGTSTNNCPIVSTSSNTINTGDNAIDSAHNYAIATYNYYLNNHGRDSIDDNGMTLISRVHYDSNYNNAFWDGSRMTYGDGDGVTFVPLSQDADVVAHELTHGVTERSSNLVYSNESGALNEALSDIFGAMVDRQEGATGADIWLLGEDIYTPGTPGDGLRVMDDPAAAGDYDYYPTRYTGSSDNGGVHWNSGIANLAFVLLVEGGTHPRGATSVNVPGIGFQPAADIFYAANTACLTSSSNFKAMRYCTADNAGSNAAAVHLAWDAVGVPVNTAPIALTDGSGLSGLSGSTSDEQQYTLDVASGASSLDFTTSGSNGDADLYVRHGSEATQATFDCSSTSADSNEICSFTNPQSGTWYAMVHAWASYSNLTVTGTTGGGGGGCSPLGASCSAASDCCSNKCKGKNGSQTCK
jgi:bacillolysin